MSRAIPIPNDDEPKRLRLLSMVVDALGTQAEACRAIGVESSTMSQWLSGKRSAPEWHVIHGALKRTLTRCPHMAPVFVEVLAADLLDLEGTWKPRPDDEDVGDYSDESDDVTIVHGELTQGVRKGDRSAVERASLRIVTEAEQAAKAARRAVGAR